MPGLGLVHVKGNLCKYESVAAGNRRRASKAGNFVRCVKAGQRGWKVAPPLKSATKKKRAAAKRGSSSAAKKKTKKKSTRAKSVELNCIRREIPMRKKGGGTKMECREICRVGNRFVSNKLTTGCK